MTMLIPLTAPPRAVTATGPVSPLNAVWMGSLPRRMDLPQLGHLLLVFPLAESVLSCAGVTLDGARYLSIGPTESAQIPLEAIAGQGTTPRVLVLWISPPFIADMAHFLGIPDNLPELLHDVPLLQGDPMSQLLTALAAACGPPVQPALVDDLFMEAVGQVLQRMRLRHEALLRLAHHKQSTVSDLLPRLLRARQFVEARYAQDIKTKDVAEHAALSEYHFARLFKTAFDTTLRQYIIRLRLDAARHMLEQPSASVTDVSLCVGYNSLSTFIHAFTRQFGTSPSRYQARAQNAQDLTSRQPADGL